MPLITTNLELAIADLSSGKPVAIPTETVYGLAAMINNPEAIQSVFAMKNRPLNHPLIVHVAQNWDFHELVEDIPDYAYQLIEKFWPGPLTLIFHTKKNKVNPLITGGQTTVALRCPNHEMTQLLLARLNTPVVAPSANPFGKVSPTTAMHVKEGFPDQNLTILDGGRCTIGIESTIVLATKPDCYTILRHGLIDEIAIEATISIHSLENKGSIQAPGMLASHYQPQKKLYYFDDYALLSDFCHKKEPNSYVIASQKPPITNTSLFHLLAEKPEQVAFDLYYQLKEADASKANCISIELPPKTSQWQGIRERILKAGTPFPAE